MPLFAHKCIDKWDFCGIIFRHEKEYDPLAQKVEHMTFNHGVRSSTLRWITIPQALRKKCFFLFPARKYIACIRYRKSRGFASALLFVSRKPPAKRVVPERLLPMSNPAAAVAPLCKGSCRRRRLRDCFCHVNFAIPPPRVARHLPLHKGGEK